MTLTDELLKKLCLRNSAAVMLTICLTAPFNQVNVPVSDVVYTHKMATDGRYVGSEFQVSTPKDLAYVPRTELGKKLLALRERAIRGGMRLMTEEEILREVKIRRGELPDGKV